MGLITKSDLYYKDYSWTAIGGDDPEKTGEPDRSLLNRKEGYEVLPFINKFCREHNLKSKKSAEKVEKIIRNEVPSDIRSQEKIITWIEENWDNGEF